MADKSEPKLLSFFVFNSIFGPREGEEEKKILYFYPPETDIDSKIKQMGLCEAFAKFTETFSEVPCQSVHTQRRRQTFYSPEEDYWMVMTVSVPTVERLRESQRHVEYRDEELQDGVLEALLQQAYYMFRLFMGTFDSIVKTQEGQEKALKIRLEFFFSKYLTSMKVGSADVLDMLHGIIFLPLDKHTYLRTQSLINILEAEFPSVHHTALLYNDQLVWSGLEQEDMRVVYRYLTTQLLPAHMETELQGQSHRSTAHHTHFGRYVLGPASLSGEGAVTTLRRVHISTGVWGSGGLRCFFLVVYKALSATLALLLPESETPELKLFRQLDEFLGPRLSQLASDIAEQYSARPLGTVPGESLYKYVYFNHMNVACKSTLHGDGRRSLQVPTDVLHLLADLLSDLRKWEHDGETTVKTQDYWVVGKKSDQREFLVVIQQKNANLSDIHDEVKRLCQSQFTNVFFLD